MVEGEGKAPEVAPVVERSPFGLNVRWPTTVSAWAGLVILLATDAWLIYSKQAEGAMVLTGVILSGLGLSAQQSAAISLAVAASTRATRAVDVAEAAATQTHETLQNVEVAATQANEKLQIVQEAVKDIQDNPNQPGTPGWMGRNAPSP